ncbi:hypothetical protein [Thermococcus eurythermalis]|uniref:hypothetical protein n=1 Tax=Thermococcus eurythermalis TaxID=1505907 RepID=UPI000AFE9B2A|nr:hypothetical protein [Thermococcus eurythermalis]
MRVFVRDYLMPWLLTVGFWVVLWTISSEMRDNLSPLGVIAVVVLLVPFLIAALHFVGKALERYGYSREDLKRLPEIIEKTHGRLYLAKEIFDIIGKTLVFWGLFSTVVLLAGDPVRGLLNGIALWAYIFAFFIVLVSMVIWVMVFPLSLYRLITGREPDRGLLIEVTIKQNLLYTAVLVTVRLIALHLSYPSGDDLIGRLFALGRSTRLWSFSSSWRV